jgi:hypothetical protein
MDTIEGCTNWETNNTPLGRKICCKQFWRTIVLFCCMHACLAIFTLVSILAIFYLDLSKIGAPESKAGDKKMMMLIELAQQYASGR